MKPAILLLLCLCILLPMRSQEILGTEPYDEQQHFPFHLPSITSVSGKTTALTLPFIDDFSFGNSLVGVYWDRSVSKDSTPLLVPTAMKVPGRGCVVFDGIDSLNNAYVTASSASGLGDRLVSMPIDLSMLTPADSVGISFCFQSGGRSDKPESGDTLYLMGDTTGSGDFAPIWAAAGGTSDTAFRSAIIMLTDPAFFHSAFRLMFASSGNLNGKNDVWYLDMLRVNSGRNRFDTVWADESVAELATSPLAPYSAIPRRLWPALTGFSPVDTRIHSLNIFPRTKTLTQTLSDETGANILSGTLSYSDPGASSPFSEVTIPSSQFFSSQTLSTATTLKVTTSFTGGGSDNIGNNDTIYTRIPADSVLGFDDGTAESVYGINAARFFGYKMTLPSPDTLSGIWIHFVPAVYIPPLGTTISMEGLPFKVVILDYPHPDSILFSQNSGMTIRYSDTLNQYLRYAFTTKVAVPDTFWIGIEQVDGRPVAVGFDCHYDNSDRIFFENSTGLLQNTTFTGSLMIRPEFYSQPPAVGLEAGISRTRLQIHPNPTHGSFSLAGVSHSGIIRVYDLAGKCVYEDSCSPAHCTFETALLPGMYQVVVSGSDGASRSGSLLILP